MAAAGGVPTPLVRVVILNFDGGQMTLDCIESLLATQWPSDRLEIVMVDNGSIDDSVARVRDRFPAVRIIEPLANTGFAGGCNLGLRAPGHFDFVALVNNDATVDPGWLCPLVGALQADPSLGAVSAKMLFHERVHEIRVFVPDLERDSDDPRLLGVRVSGFRVDGERDDDRFGFDERFHLPEPPDAVTGEEIGRWSSAHGAVRVRGVAADGDPSIVSLRVATRQQRLVVLSSDVADVAIELGPAARWVDLAVGGPPIDVINNVGSNLYTNGFSGDRGFLERDRGQYDERAEVFGWCGGAVLLRPEYLADVGCFDDRFFLYYEDTDLSWRGRLRGWRYEYVPDSVVRHRHAASSGVGSPVFRFHTERNRVLVLLKNAPLTMGGRAVLGLWRRLAAAAVRDLVVRPLRLQLPIRREVAYQWRLTGSVMRLLPSLLAERWRDRITVDRRSVLRWEVPR
jgi:hypothetical protein